jgi:hypothetical protein
MLPEQLPPLPHITAPHATPPSAAKQQLTQQQPAQLQQPECKLAASDDSASGPTSSTLITPDNTAGSALPAALLKARARLRLRVLLYLLGLALAVVMVPAVLLAVPAVRAALLHPGVAKALLSCWAAVELAFPFV